MNVQFCLYHAILVLFALFSICILHKTTNEFCCFSSMIRTPLRHSVRLNGVSHNGKHVMTGERLCPKAQPLMLPRDTKQVEAGSAADTLQSFLMTLAELPPSIQRPGVSFGRLTTFFGHTNQLWIRGWTGSPKDFTALYFSWSSLCSVHSL